MFQEVIGLMSKGVSVWRQPSDSRPLALMGRRRKGMYGELEAA